MVLTDKIGNKWFYIISENDKTIELNIDGISHLILEKNNKNLIIKDVFVNKSYRNNGIWKSMMIEIKLATKEKYINIISLGQFRRPVASRVWKTLDKKEIKNKNGKIDYYY